MLLSDLPEKIRPRLRVMGSCRGVSYRKGTVAGVGVLRGREVVYVAWDTRHHVPASTDTVVASALLVLDAG